MGSINMFPGTTQENIGCNNFGSSDSQDDDDDGDDGDGDGYGGGDVTAAPSSSVRETSVLLTVEIKQHFVTVRRAIDAISLSRRWMEFPAV